VKIEVTSLAGAKMEIRGAVGSVNFDMKVKLEELERRSQMTSVGFNIQLTTKPAILKLEVGGTAVLTGKDEEIRKMLETDLETKVPAVLIRIYQHAFTSMYILATVLDSPPPPYDLLNPNKQGMPTEGVNVEVATEKSEAKEPDGVTVQVDTRNVETKSEQREK
jgi:hypothetical protein